MTSQANPTIQARTKSLRLRLRQRAAETTRSSPNAAFGQNFVVRLAALKAAGLIKSNAEIADAGGFSRQYFGSQTRAPSATVQTVSKFALLLGVPARALLDVDGGAVANYPLPDFNWLEAIAENKDELGFGAESSTQPDWTIFAEVARPLYPWSPK